MWQPAMGGLIIGALLLAAPEVMGVGYEYVDLALNGGFVFRTMVVLCLLKLVATTVSYSSGNAGGIFAPSLYIGAMAGGAVGMAVHHVAPFPTGDPGAYALVGMGTLFAGIVRAPMTSVFMIFEITQDYQILVPLMVANLLSFVISRRYQPVPVYHALLHQDGIHLPSAALRAAPSGWIARDVMAREIRFVPPDMSVSAALEADASNGIAVWAVGDPDHFVSVVSKAQLSAAVSSGQGGDVVATVAPKPVVHAHPDHPLDVVLERLAQAVEVLPIVSREDAQRLEGVVTFESIARRVRAKGSVSAKPR
jgi:CIC family chloride channel protein